MWWRGLVWPNRAEQVNNRKCAADPAWGQTCQVGEDDDDNNDAEVDDDDGNDDDDDDLKLGGRLARWSNMKITIKNCIWPTLNHINPACHQWYGSWLALWSNIKITIKNWSWPTLNCINFLSNILIWYDSHVIKDQDQKFDLIKVKSDQSCSLVIVL